MLGYRIRDSILACFFYFNIEPVEIGEVEDVTVDIGEVASFICVATGTDVTISWEIEGQRYTDCSNEDFCVNTTEIDSMSVSSTIAIDSSSTIAANAMSTMPNDVRVQCIALQMCGAVSSNGTLIFQGERRCKKFNNKLCPF